ncbi:hypothetical protein BDB00DRAFT_773747 [Zychaea mexicana]|uniref:uncharacterized protein n=1 Tax=Zychaea mexicana TaxID=64656 RepID=UPI0022FF2F05|nr:uncharacterized protein BDB00DRAFT_773747 [Zychaea mexicana]KAI9485052.1 hypothetical protein BDB00DRAFT_773747 [Zychaea mexicana]
MPCDTNHNGTNGPKEFISKAWGLGTGYFYGQDDVSFVADPFDKTSGDKVLRVLYQKGSFSPKGTRNEKGDITGGTEFYLRPFNDTSFKRGYVRYDVAFDENLDWVKGGKLPGIYGGEPTSGCTGGKQADGTRCFSVRMMWREDGHGEAYAYLPPSNDRLCTSSLVKCNSDYGTSLARGYVKFTNKKWSRVEIYTQMNDPGKNNGELRVWQDGHSVIDLKGLVFRNQKSFAVSSVLFSSFFGGSSKEYATPKDTYTYFKNLQFSVADEQQLEPVISEASTPSSSTLPSTWLMVFVILTLQMHLFVFSNIRL